MVHGVHPQSLFGLEGHVTEWTEVMTTLIMLNKVSSQPLFSVARVVAVRTVHVLHTCANSTYVIGLGENVK